ncbi:DUF222 domain-containing protein [Rhodococcus hoagii]|nr:DUF222 domain-containing protein [Prescottella equi]
MCFDVCAKDPRTDAQRRADALVALASGHTHLDCTCGRDDCATHARFPTRDDPPRPFGRLVQVLVGVDASTLLGSTTPPATCSATAPSTPIWRGISLRTAHGNGCSPSPIAIAFDSHQRQPVRQARSSVSAPHFRRRDRHPPMSRCAFANAHTDLAASLRRPCGSGTAGVVSRTAPSKPVRAISTTRSRSITTTRTRWTHYRSEPRVLVSQTPSAENTRPLGRPADRRRKVGMVGSLGRPVVTEPYGPFTDTGLREISAGISTELLDRVTDSATVAALNYSRAELDLDYLLDVHIPPRQRRRRGHTPRHGSSRTTIEPETSLSATADDSPPF